MKKFLVKKTVIVMFMGFAANAHAMAEGFYLGIMGGPSNNSGQPIEAFTEEYRQRVNDCAAVSSNINIFNACLATAPAPLITVEVHPRMQQFATRIYAGNLFNPYAGLELGLTFFSAINYSCKTCEASGIEVVDASRRIRTIDFVLKGILPVPCFRLSVFGKAGVALTYITGSKNFGKIVRKRHPDTDGPFFEIKSPSTNKFSGVVSLGAAYDINENWQFDLSANYLLAGGNLGRITWYALGISYHFVDRYCGQFLCDD